MGLVTLIAACALSVDPNVMHALIWEQSGGEPCSFSVPDEAMPRVLPTIQDAIREARALRPEGGRIRVGLAGLSTDPRSVTAVLFAPCPNITLAARRITQLVERCKTASRPDPIYCTIAAYRGSWDRPNARFADSVRATVEKGNAPNFDMPKDAYFDATSRPCRRQPIHMVLWRCEHQHSTIACVAGQVGCFPRSHQSQTAHRPS